MLVLTRNEGESVVIGDGIVVAVVKLRSGDVSLGFTAPRDVPILRQELFEPVRNSRGSTNKDWTKNEQ